MVESYHKPPLLPSQADIARGRVKLQYARAGHLVYVTTVGDMRFQVPFEEIGNATFLPDDRAMLFMRWIRPVVKAIYDSQSDASAQPVSSTDSGEVKS